MAETRLLLWVLIVCSLATASYARSTHRSDQDGVQKKFDTSPAGKLWPKPQQQTSSGNMLTIDAAVFRFVNYGVDNDLVNAAYERYRAIIFGNNGRSRNLNAKSQSLKFMSERVTDTTVTNLAVTVAVNCPGYPSLDSDESYVLTISANSTLYVSTCWGALRGLETFSQLVQQTDEGTYVIPETVIHDSPRFNHRGILLDTSRHFIKKEIILEHLDAMAQNKFNVFHWHIVDDQSFPFQSFQFPGLSAKGAYSPSHIYSRADVKEIIEYARYRGIRVMVEFDSPGHTQSWGKSQPGLLTACYDSQGHPTGGYGPIDPTVNSTYLFLHDLFSEVSLLFPDHYIFLGGDEVSFDCWKSNPKVTAFMDKMGYGTNYSLLEQYYEQRLVNMVAEMKKGYMVWQEVIDNDVKVAADTVVDVWKGNNFKPELAKVTSLGYKTILSACWYLNYISYGSDWRKYYTCDPTDFDGSAQQKTLILGGEAAMWGEFIDDTNLISTMWPRASAVAERLWSAANVTDINDATSRIAAQRCRMVKRGFNAKELMGPGFCDVEF